MEWAIEKCTELGVTQDRPGDRQPHRVSSRPAAAGKRVERWQRIAQQASEQSRRHRSAEHRSSPSSLSAAAQMTAGTRIVLSESERQLALKDALQRIPQPRSYYWPSAPKAAGREEELAVVLEEPAGSSASLGSTILRAETAAIAATAIAFAELS